MEKKQVVKKTFNIEKENISDMQRMIGSRKQTEFVNKALRKSLDEMKKKASKKAALSNLKKLASMKNKPHGGKNSLDLLRELRTTH